MTNLLTTEESTVLDLLANGNTYKEIRQKTGFTRYKIIKLKEQCVEKLNAKNITHAVYIGFKIRAFG